ncbi:glutamate receptor 2-like [Biomphalaria glabrata]|uniref:Glutamate receptor 2-like n=2 Tax=Biomphalaria glabrata TaxID=6526 RepID=A0A9W3A1Q2_BIOGL|nr:glutamate receptor 2-like [Biomphalaria glabrata]
MWSLLTLSLILPGLLVSHVPPIQGKELVVSTLLISPFLKKIETTEKGKTVVRYEGFIHDLLQKIFNITGTQFIYAVRQDKRYGQQLENGSWDGLIGDVLNKKADIAAAPLTETSKRRSVVDFSTPFMSFGPVIIMKRPTKKVMTLEERLQRLFQPLSDSVWLMSGLAWLVTSVVLYVICHFNPYDWRRLAKDRQASLREGESFTCLNSFFFTMSTVLWQGYTRSPRSVGARVVVCFWWFYVLIFLVMYIASMTNYLRVGPTPAITETYAHIQTIEDLVNQDEMNYGVISSGATRVFFAESELEVFKKANDKMTKSNTFVNSLESGIERVRKLKNFALIAESAMAKYYTKQKPCDIYMVGDFTTLGVYSLAFPLNFNQTLVREINMAIVRMRESGGLKALEDKWFSGQCKGFLLEQESSSKLQIPPFYEVDLGSFSGALILLGLGLILGSIVTALEICLFKLAESSEKEEEENQEKLNEPKHIPLAADMEPITDV